MGQSVPVHAEQQLWFSVFGFQVRMLCLRRIACSGVPQHTRCATAESGCVSVLQAEHQEGKAAAR
jgi:hypothetical protein